MRRPARGFALLLVLWTLVPVSALFLTLAGTARSDGQLAANLRAAARLQAAADGGIETAILLLLQPSETLPAPKLAIGAATVSVAATPLDGLLNPNLASDDLLEALFEVLDVEPARAAALAAAMLDWRTPGEKARPGGAKAAEYRAAGKDYGPPGAPFETVDELGLVLGMTPALLDALHPYLTVWTDLPADPALAPPAVRAALARRGQTARRAQNFGNTFRLTAVADGFGTRVVRQAVVKLTPGAGGRPWHVLAWTTGPAPP